MEPSAHICWVNMSTNLGSWSPRSSVTPDRSVEGVLGVSGKGSSTVLGTSENREFADRFCPLGGSVDRKADALGRDCRKELT